MKKNDIIMLISVLAYSYLFYEQSAGVNFFIFTAILTISQVVRDGSLLKNRAWIFSSLGALISGACVMMYGNGLSVFANITSLAVASIFSVNPSSSLIFALVHTVYNYTLGYLRKLERYVNREKPAQPAEGFAYTSVFVSLVPILVAFVFFFMYREGNPLFKEATDALNFEFLTFGWFFFTLLGALLLLGFFKAQIIESLDVFDVFSKDGLQYSGEAPQTGFFSLPDQNKSGIIMLLLLNMMLLLVNLLDLNFLFNDHRLPEGLTYKEFVHQGVYTLIISIVLAIAVILYYLRGDLNFYAKNKWLKVLAYIWIVQNVILVIGTGAKNDIYIVEFGLTYKRIGVYVYLLLTLIGLIVTIIKVYAVKSNLFLFRKNAWAFYMVLIVSCLFNWDLFITRYNIANARTLDRAYLLSLSDSVLPDLMNLQGDENFKPKDTVVDVDMILKSRGSSFLMRFEREQWQSWTMEDQRIYQALSHQ